MKKIITIILLSLSLNSFCQNIGFNYGMYSYFGDLEKSKNIKAGTNWQSGFGISIGKTFENGLELNVNLNKHHLSQNEVKIDSNLNFKSSVIEISGSVIYRLDNDIIINKSSKISPYIGLGLGSINYSTNYDYLDKNGNNYHYWTDGSIRNQEENYDNVFTSEKIRRDYVYETESGNEGRTIVFPIIIGVDLKISPKLSFGILSKYYISNTDLLDNYEKGGNDSYYYIGTSLKYYINKKRYSSKNENIKFRGVDFGKIDKMDQDNDGVIDTKDLCQGTKKGIDVDEYGCPFDLDKDFVYDYKDKELNTLDSSAVTVEGITITDEHFQIMYMLYHGQIYPVEDFFYENFPYIPVLLRREMAESVTIDTKEQRFKTSEEELKQLVKEIKIIGTNGEEIKIFTSGGEQKQ